MKKSPYAIAGLCAATVIIAACASSSSGSSSNMSVMPMGGPAGGNTTVSGDIPLTASPAMHYPANAPVGSPDPRVGLKPGEGIADAGVAAWNMRLVSNSPASEGFSGRGATGSDLAFTSHYAIQGNYRGFQIWDIA